MQAMQLLVLMLVLYSMNLCKKTLAGFNITKIHMLDNLEALNRK